MKTLLVFDSIETSLTFFLSFFLFLLLFSLSHSFSPFSLSLDKKVHLNHTISVCVHKLWLFHPFLLVITHFLSFSFFLSCFFFLFAFSLSFSWTLRKICKREKEWERMHLDHQTLLWSIHHFSRERERKKEKERKKETRKESGLGEETN